MRETGNVAVMPEPAAVAPEVSQDSDDLLAVLQHKHDEAAQKKVELANRRGLLADGLQSHLDQQRELLIAHAKGDTSATAKLDQTDAAIVSTRRELAGVEILCADAEQAYNVAHEKLVTAKNELQKRAQERALSELEGRVRQASREVTAAYEQLVTRMSEFEKLTVELDQHKPNEGYRFLISVDPQQAMVKKGYERRGRLRFTEVHAMKPPKSG